MLTVKPWGFGRSAGFDGWLPWLEEVLEFLLNVSRVIYDIWFFPWSLELCSVKSMSGWEAIDLIAVVYGMSNFSIGAFLSGFIFKCFEI